MRSSLQDVRQFIFFIGVGIACAVIDVGLMQILIVLGFNYLLAATVGFAAGLSANFMLHTRLTFSARYSHRVFLRFMGVVLVNYCLTILCVSLFHRWLDMPVLGKIFSLPMVTVIGFFLSKHWVYK